MKIREIKDPMVFKALKRVCFYIANNVWTICLTGSSVGEAEYAYAVAKSKEYEKDIEILAKLDDELEWGHKKHATGKNTYHITGGGEFNPWYNGDLTLSQLLDTIEPIVELETTSNLEMMYCELNHYFEFLKKFNGEDLHEISIEHDIEQIKTIMTNVATGQARIQDENDSYKNLYKRIDLYYQTAKKKNPNEFSDLWEFYSYWKKNLDSYVERRVYITKLYKVIPNLEKSKNKPIIKNLKNNYIDLERIKELTKIHSRDFDLTKLIKFCNEINIAYATDCYLSLVMLVRSLIDHIPPLFGLETFSQVASNYKGGRSFNDSMKHLDISLRKIADSYLHTHIRSKESLPKITQVDFSNDVDVLLGEIYRKLK